MNKNKEFEVVALTLGSIAMAILYILAILIR